jgi:hypothetical protein
LKTKINNQNWKENAKSEDFLTTQTSYVEENNLKERMISLSKKAHGTR